MTRVPISVVMRSRNDMPLVRKTVAALARQTVQCELIALDNASVDGTREFLEEAASRVVAIPEAEYMPGRVLNQAMRMTSGEVVIFLNADCIPRGERWVERLLAGFTSSKVAAVFGRQIPRAECDPLFARDTEATFGDGTRQDRWRHCFSMAASAIRRSAWRAQPFDETLRYSEDIAWTWQAKRRGLAIGYVPDAVVTHSHNYTLRSWYRRQFGEGQAEAAIFTWSRWRRSLLRYTLLPLVAQTVGDWRYCARHGFLGSAGRTLLLRVAQGVGRRRGFLRGLRAARA